MKGFTSKALKILFNKITLFTVLFNWILLLLALYQRGYWEWTGHFVSDPILFQLVILLNFPTISIVLNFILPPTIVSETDQSKDGVIFLIAMTIQWWVIGCVIKQVFFSKKNNESIGE